MKFATVWRNSLFAACLLLAACTVIPVTVRDRVPSFDGNDATSGYLGRVQGNDLITATARARYNLLVQEYGARYRPPLVPDAGLTATATNTWIIDRQHLADFIEMQAWKKTAAAP